MVMTAQPLLDVLLPAYAPCRHFTGACAGACVWEPENGRVPCAFGGATGSLDEVRLVIITAEPGDPPDKADYRGTPEEMIRNSLRIFHNAMESGGIERREHPTPFHKNMKHILDTFWPDEALDAQLRKTWTTNAVLCPAKVSGGAHPNYVEQACTATYLARQLDLFPTAFVLALGGKARDRLRAAGLRFDAIGLHPSARGSIAKKMASWNAAARQFRGEPIAATSKQPDAGSSSGPNPRSTQKPSQPKVVCSGDLWAALPGSVATFFARVARHPDYDCRMGRMQLMVFFRGEKVGGLNRQASHWYFSKLFVGKHGNPGLMATYGFEHVLHNQKHEYWLGRGFKAVAGYEKAMVAMTGVHL